MHVVWFAEIKWDYLRTRKQQLIRRRPPDIDVLFLEPFVRDRENSRDVRATDGIRVVTIPFIKNVPSGAGRAALTVPLARRLVDAAALARVRGHLRREGIDARDSLFVISNVFAIGVARAFAPRRLVYDCNDAHADFPGLPGWARRYQEETLRSAHRVIVSAQRLRDDAVRVRGGDRDIFMVGNGVDSDAFASALELRPREPRERPCIGYLGAIAPWFDFDLLMEAAASRPEWDFVLVGPVLRGAGPSIETLSALRNVTVRPAVTHDDVPAVLAGFDVGVIPFRRTVLTAGVNPNKLYEYLAAGLPVVSTPFSAEVVEEPDLVARAQSTPDFTVACERMLAARRDRSARVRLEERARSVAAAHDWNRIAREFWARVCDPA